MHTAYNYSEEFVPAREQFEKLVIQLQHMLSADHRQIVMTLFGQVKVRRIGYSL